MTDLTQRVQELTEANDRLTAALTELRTLLERLATPAQKRRWAARAKETP